MVPHDQEVVGAEGITPRPRHAHHTLFLLGQARPVKRGRAAHKNGPLSEEARPLKAQFVRRP